MCTDKRKSTVSMMQETLTLKSLISGFAMLNVLGPCQSDLHSSAVHKANGKRTARKFIFKSSFSLLHSCFGTKSLQSVDRIDIHCNYEMKWSMSHERFSQIFPLFRVTQFSFLLKQQWVSSHRPHTFLCVSSGCRSLCF